MSECNRVRINSHELQAEVAKCKLEGNQTCRREESSNGWGLGGDRGVLEVRSAGLS